jgi:hypothetical protein
LRQLDPQRSWVAGRHGGAIRLDGHGWLECARAEAFTRLEGDLTISAWVERPARARGLHALVARQLGDTSGDRFFFGFDGARLTFSSHLLKGVLRHAPARELAGWVHLVAVHSATGGSKVFIDGVEVAQRATTRASLGGGDEPLLIGGAMNGPPPRPADELFDGALDDLALYSRALSNEEILALFRT